MRAVELFRKNPDVLEHYQRRFRHVLVDEYQDTNHAQYMLVKLLAGAHRNVFVVGDADQSVYAFRGADMRNILDFEKDYSDATVIMLEQNYRSTQTILESVAEARDAENFPLAVRMGMHVGDVIERGDDVVGHAVNIAARVAELAGPGELLVTDHVVRSLGDTGAAATFRPVGPTRVKGVAAPIWLHRLAT